MAGIYVANPEIGFYSLLPDFSKGFTIPSIMPVFGKLDFSGIFSLNFIVVIFAFLFVDMFDTIGTLIGVSTKAGMLDEEGRLPNIKGADGRCGCNNRWSSAWNNNDYDICRECIRCIRRRKNGTDFCNDSYFIRPVTVPVTNLPCNSFICNSTGPDRGWILHADKCDTH